MKKIILLFACWFFTRDSFAQPVSPQSIEDSVIGWIKVYNYKGINQPLRVDGHLYSTAQLAICDLFVNWMQASYLPKGGLGDVKKAAGEKLGLYNQHTAAKPPSYGAYSKTYTELKLNSSRKLEPFTNSHVFWNMFANLVPGDWAIRELCTPTQYYFTLPSFESSEEASEISKKKYDLSGVQNLKPYTTLWIKNLGFGGGKEVVILSKNNQFPFIKLTKGEYLQALESALPVYYEKEKKKIQEQNKGNQRSIDSFIKYLDERKGRMLTGLKANQEKYKNRLGEVALVAAQPYLTDLENNRDVFSNGYITDAESSSGRIPAYKVDPVLAALCKTDKPQWIIISWEYSPGNAVEKHLHESILNNVNFDYIYQFFFDPEKVKGQPYRPLRSPRYNEEVVMNDASATSKKNAADKNIHFFDDFSTTGRGQKPVGWKARSGNDGTSSLVTPVDGLDGHWALMGADHSLSPNQLKKPFPQDFTLSYDLVAAQHFTWGAKGLVFQLSNETTPGNAAAYLQVKLRPGFDGRDGEATIETKFPNPPGYSSGTKWMGAPGFSNNKKNNLVTVTIKKSGETLQVFLDKTKIAEYANAIPAAQPFNTFSFSSGGGSSPNDIYYISNIKITRN